MNLYTKAFIFKAIGLLSFLILSTAAHADWRHTLYGSVPEDCAKLKVDEQAIYRCQIEEQQSASELQQFSQLDEFFKGQKSEALDAKYEAALLKKLADSKASEILEAYSQYALLASSSISQLEKSYQQLPLACLKKTSASNQKLEQHLQSIMKLSADQLKSNQHLRIKSLTEDLSYLAQLNRSKKELQLQKHLASNSNRTDQAKLMEKAIQSIDQMAEQIRMKEPLLTTKAFKGFESAESFRAILEEPDRAASSAVLEKQIKEYLPLAASELKNKLGENDSTGLKYLCKAIEGDLVDLVHHRLALGVKEAELVDALISQDDQLNKLTEIDRKNGKITAEQIAYSSLLNSAACRLKLKVINNSSVDLAREFALNAGLTIGTAGMSTLATGFTVGSKVVVAAQTGRASRVAMAGITTLDVASVTAIDLPQLYENCIKGNVAQDHFFINSNITPMSCGLSIGMTGLSSTLVGIGAKNTIKAFRNSNRDQLLSQAVQTNLFAKSDIRYSKKLEEVEREIEKLNPEQLLKQATQITGESIADLNHAKEIVRAQRLIAVLPSADKDVFLKLTLQNNGSISPKGKIPKQLDEHLKMSAEAPIGEKIELLDIGISQTAVKQEVGEQLITSGHIGNMSRSELIPAIKQRVDQKFRFSQLVGDEQSEQFLRQFQKSNAINGKKVLFFNVENTVQKLLNDSYIVDKELVDSLNDAYKRMIYQEIKKNPHLSSALAGEFNDFKSLKLAFDKSKASSDVLNSELSRVFKKANNDFAQYCKELGVKGLLTKDGQPVKGMVGDPRHWFIAGTGDSLDMSSIFARLTKNHYRADRSTQLITGKHFSKELKELANQTENIRQQVSAILKDHPQAMSNGILDEELVAILRKAASKGHGEEYYKAVQKKVTAAYPGIDLNNSQIDLLRSYYHSADTFSPPVLSATRVTHNLDQATGDVVSFDYRGIGALNGQANMQALKEWDGKDMEKLATLIRQHDDAVTNRLVRLREQATTKSVEEAFQDIQDVNTDWLKSNITYSGDDGILKIPSSVKQSYLTKYGEQGQQKYNQAIEAIYQRSVANLQSLGERADRVRITKVNAVDLKKIVQVPIGEQISKQEGIEKGIREFLQGKIPGDEDFLLTVESNLSAHGNLTYSIRGHQMKNGETIQRLIKQYIDENQIPTTP